MRLIAEYFQLNNEQTWFAYVSKGQEFFTLMQLEDTDESGKGYQEAVAKSTNDQEKAIKLIGPEPAYARDYNDSNGIFSTLSKPDRVFSQRKIYFLTDILGKTWF